MVKLGQEWGQRVARNEENYRVLSESIARREAEAEKWVAQVQLRDLADGIAACIGRASDSLALPVPTELVTTSALRSYQSALAAQGLLSDIAVDAEGQGLSLLLLTPHL